VKRGIFISYRRRDSAGAAGRIRDKLTQEFGGGRVFMDVADIAPGVNFEEAIKERIGAAGAVVAIIGPSWSTDLRSSVELETIGKPDYMRLEISAALRAGVRVIPVLVDDARMPAPNSLPPSLKKLSKINALEIRHTKFDNDVSDLVEVLKDLEPKRPWIPVTAAAGLFLIAAGAVFLPMVLRDGNGFNGSDQQPGGDSVPSTFNGGDVPAGGDTATITDEQPRIENPPPAQLRPRTASVELDTRAPATYSIILQSGEVVASGAVNGRTPIQGVPAQQQVTIRLIWRVPECSPSDTLWLSPPITLAPDSVHPIPTKFNCL